MRNIEIKIKLKEAVESMTPLQRVMYQKNRKKLSTYLILLLLLGAFGAHFFYREKNLFGALSLVFCWTLIPSVSALVCLFTCDKDINKFNYYTLIASNF